MDLGISRPRSAALVLASSGLLLSCLHWALSPVRSAADPFATTLQAGAVWLLVVCCGWLVAVSTALLVEAFSHQTHRPPRWCAAPASLRRLVALSSGAALSLGLAAPAMADPPAGVDTSVLLDGLRLPERAVGSASPTDDSDTTTHVVAPGDSLWRITRDRAPGADNDEIAALVAALHQHNIGLIGPDPDVVVPGQRLALPESLR